MLLNAGAKRDGQDQHSQTPVFLACKEGNEDIVQLLVDNFVNIKIPNDMDQLPVDIAVERGHQKIVDTLTNFNAKPLSSVQSTVVLPNYIQQYLGKNKNKKPASKTEGEVAHAVSMHPLLQVQSEAPPAPNRTVKKPKAKRTSNVKAGYQSDLQMAERKSEIKTLLKASPAKIVSPESRDSSMLPDASCIDRSQHVDGEQKYPRSQTQAPRCKAVPGNPVVNPLYTPQPYNSIVNFNQNGTNRSNDLVQKRMNSVELSPPDSAGPDSIGCTSPNSVTGSQTVSSRVVFSPPYNGCSRYDDSLSAGRRNPHHTGHMQPMWQNGGQQYSMHPISDCQSVDPFMMNTNSYFGVMPQMDSFTSYMSYPTPSPDVLEHCSSVTSSAASPPSVLSDWLEQPKDSPPRLTHRTLEKDIHRWLLPNDDMCWRHCLASTEDGSNVAPQFRFMRFFFYWSDDARILNLWPVLYNRIIFCM